MVLRKSIVVLVVLLISSCKAGVNVQKDNSAQVATEGDESPAPASETPSTPPSTLLSLGITSASLSLTRNKSTIYGKIKVTVTTSFDSSDKKLEDYKLALTSDKGTFDNLTYIGKTSAEVDYHSDESGIASIGISINGIKVEAASKEVEFTSFEDGWRESFPGKFSTDQEMTYGITSMGSDNVAMDSNGNAIIVWKQYDGSSNALFKSEYQNGVWTHPASQADSYNLDGQHVADPTVVMNASGQAAVVWTQSDGTNSQVYIAERNNGIWTYPSSLTDNLSVGGQSATFPRVALSDNGDIVVIWKQSNGSHDQLFMAERRSGNWTLPADLNDNISFDGSAVKWNYKDIAINATGETIISWKQTSDLGSDQVYIANYRNGSWSTPTGLNDVISLNHATHSASTPAVAIDSSGNISVVFVQQVGTNENVYRKDYRSDTWQSLATVATGDCRQVDVAMNPSGEAIIAWSQHDGTRERVYKAEFDGSSWSYPADLSDGLSPTAAPAFPPRVSIADNGHAIISWIANDGVSQQIYKAEYRGSSLLTPSSLADGISRSGEE